MTQILNHFRLITFFCLFIITITYFFMHSNMEKIKASGCDEDRLYPIRNGFSNRFNNYNKRDDIWKLLDATGYTKETTTERSKISRNRVRMPYFSSLNELTNGRGNSINEANNGERAPGINLQIFHKNNHKLKDKYETKKRPIQIKQFTFASELNAFGDQGTSNPNSFQTPQFNFEHYGTSLADLKFEDKGKSARNLVFQKKKPMFPSTSVSVAKNKISRLDKGHEAELSVDELSRILTDKIRLASSMMRKSKTKPGCDSNATIANSCDNNKCLRKFISEDPKQRVIQLVTPKKLQLSYGDISTILNMRSKVSEFYDTVLLTAASSNHFFESQALLKNLQDVIFPNLKNFVLIYYNLGLTTKEIQQLRKVCKCKIVDFPFDEVPEFVSNLKCYSWKPLMIKAHIEQGNVLVWMDASVRFQSIEDFNALIQRTKERGFQMAGPSEKSPFRTVRSMYHFFGEEPCAYLQMGQLHATNGFFKRDSFVKRAILEPWAACALNKNCICPTTVKQKLKENEVMIKNMKEKGGPIVYGLVHRYDQSALSLIIHKLFYKYYPFVLFDKARYGVKFLRRHTYNFFPLSTQNNHKLNAN